MTAESVFPRSVTRRAAATRWERLPGVSPGSRHLEETIDRVARFECPVLLTGETGSGKEEVARAIHAASARREGPFVSVNCGGLVTSLAESQLFGHEKGSFTGAIGSTIGAFRAAQRGVLFLDEIGELPLEIQPRLLHVLQRLEVSPVGSTQPEPVDVMVIAATNRDLDAEAARGGFREDLLYRLNTVHIMVPPLRARPDDIPHLIEHFAVHYAEKYDRPRWQPEPEVLARLVGHSWPGNVRQLAQVVQRIYVFENRRDTILAELFGTLTEPVPIAANLEPPVARPQAPQPVVEAPRLPVVNLAELRRLAVRQTMADTNGHRGRAAELLGVSLNTMTRLVAEACPELPSTNVGRKRAVRPR